MVFQAFTHLVPGDADGLAGENAPRPTLGLRSPRRFDFGLRFVRVVEAGEELRGDIRPFFGRKLHGLAQDALGLGRHKRNCSTGQIGGERDGSRSMGILTKRTEVRTLGLMKTIPATKARQNLYRLVDEVAESSEPVTITGRRGNAVLVSEDGWRAIDETLYLLSIPGMRESIREGMAEPLSKAVKKLAW